MPYQGSHVASLQSQVVANPGGAAAVLWRGRLRRSERRPGRGTPSFHPGRVARKAGRQEAPGRLRGRVARSRSHCSGDACIATARDRARATPAGMPPRPGCQPQKCGKSRALRQRRGAPAGSAPRGQCLPAKRIDSGLDPRKQIAAERQENRRDPAEHGEIGRDAELRGAAEGAPDPIDAVGQRIETHRDPERRG